MNAVRYSAVVPAFNEAGSIGELYAELSAALATLDGGYEIVFVDDGSRDGTADKIGALAAEHPEVRLVRFVSNFGKSAAYTAAFAEVRGEVVLTLDADLQDDPNEIPRMLEKLGQGFDLVIGWKQGRFENEPHKALPSKVFNGMIALLFGLRLHDSNCGFRVMRREVATTLDLYGDQYRFIPELAHVRGFKVTEIGVHHRKRKHGQSKYGPKRFVTGFLDLVTVRFLTAFGQRPLHFFGTVGFGLASLGLLLELYVLASKLLGNTFQEHVAAIVIGVMLVLMGFQSVLTGLVGEMTALQQRSRGYVVDRRQAR